MSHADLPAPAGSLASSQREQPPGTRPGIAPGVHRPGLVLAFLCIAQFMVFLDVSIVNVALPSIEHGLRITPANLPYVVTLYGTILGGFLLLGSRLADTFGRRRVLRAGLALFGVASLASGLAHDQALLFAARGTQGLGSALIAPAALSTLTGGAQRAKALGVWGALTGIASVAGVVLSGGPGWRWVVLVCFEGLKDDLLGSDLACPHAFAERRGGDDELVVREQGVAVGVVDKAEPINQHRADPLDWNRSSMR